MVSGGCSVAVAVDFVFGIEKGSGVCMDTLKKVRGDRAWEGVDGG